MPYFLVLVHHAVYCISLSCLLSFYAIPISPLKFFIYLYNWGGGVIPARMRSEGYSSRSVCLFVRNYSRTTGYEAAYERYQQLQCYKSKKNNVAISLK